MRLRRLLPIVAVFVVVAAGCDWPNVVPPGNAPVRYRDPIFNAVTVTSNVTYGSAVNLERPDGHAATRHVPADRRHGHQSPGDRVGPRRLVLLRQQDVGRAGRRSDDVRQGGLCERLDQLPARVAGLFGIASRIAAWRFAEAAADAQTAVRFLRTNAATYRIDPNRIAIGGSSAGAITALNVAYASSENPTARVRAALSISGAHLGVGATSPGDAPALDFHCTTDPLVSYQWAVNTINAAQAQGLDAFLESWNETCHVPYAAHRQQILDQSRNFLWWEMDLAHAAT